MKLEVAKLYEKDLKIKFAEITFDDFFKFYIGDCYFEEYNSVTSTWNSHEFAIVEDEFVVGYIAYSIDWTTKNAKRFRVVNFTKQPSVRFGKLVYKVVGDIFNKFNCRKLTFGVVCGNPIEKTYDRLIDKYNGKIVGVYESDTLLMDGKLYNFKSYELYNNLIFLNKNK